MVEIFSKNGIKSSYKVLSPDSTGARFL